METNLTLSLYMKAMKNRVCHERIVKRSPYEAMCGYCMRMGFTDLSMLTNAFPGLQLEEALETLFENRV